MADGPAREMTAAEKRAARRARVLQGSESRLKLVTGQISTLKESGSAASVLEREMDSALNELLDATDDTGTDASAPLDGKGGDDDNSDSAQAAVEVLRASAALRPDPAQRRREAALRRQKKEAIVEQLLAPLQNKPELGAAPTASANSASSSAVTAAPAPTKTAPATFSRHALALRLHAFEEKAIVLVLLAAAVYLALTIDLRTIATDLDARDQILISYQELLSQGLPLDSIRQQMEREQLEAPVVARIEQLLLLQLDAKAPPSVSLASSLLPNVWDVPAYFASLVARPPVILCVLLVRLLAAAVASAVHMTFRLPDVKNRCV